MGKFATLAKAADTKHQNAQNAEQGQDDKIEQRIVFHWHCPFYPLLAFSRSEAKSEQLLSV